MSKPRFSNGPSKILILNKGSDVTTSIHDTTTKILSSSSNYVVDVVT